MLALKSAWAAVVVLLVSFQTQANTHVVQMPWHCPHHIIDSPIPQQKQIEFQLDDEGNFSSPDLQHIMQQAQRYYGKQYNFYNCINNIMNFEDFIYRAPALQKIIRKMSLEPSKESSKTIVNNLLESRSKILDAALKLKGEQSLLIPGLPIQQKLKPSTRKQILNDFMQGQMHHPKALSQEALEQILPEAIERIRRTNSVEKARDMFKKLALNLTGQFSKQSQGWQDHPHLRLSQPAFQKARASIPYQLTFYEEKVLCPNNWQPSFQQLAFLRNVLKNKPRCVNLMPGDSQQIPPRSIFRKGYLLRRLPNKNKKPVYEVALALRFNVDATRAANLTPQEQKQERQNMRKATTQCFNDYADKFKGFLGQRQIKFNIAHVSASDQEFREQGRKPQIPLLKALDSLDVKHAETTMPISDITIKQDNFRSNSVEWARNIDCATIIHEILHHVGLYDEYEDKLVPDIKCRTLGPENSIMHYHDRALVSLCSSDELNQMSKACLAQSTSCALSDLSFKDCQHGRASLLYPVHLTSIIHPGCSINALYDQCTAQAKFRFANEQKATDPKVCIKAALPECSNLWGGSVLDLSPPQVPSTPPARPRSSKASTSPK